MRETRRTRRRETMKETHAGTRAPLRAHASAAARPGREAGGAHNNALHRRDVAPSCVARRTSHRRASAFDSRLGTRELGIGNWELGTGARWRRRDGARVRASTGDS